MTFPNRRFRATMCLAITAAVCAPALAQDPPEGEAVPWALRDHFIFQEGPVTFRYDVQRAIWQFEVEGLGMVIGDIHAEIEFAEGRVLRLSELEHSFDERREFESPFGPGTHFRTVFSPRDGIGVRMALTRFKERPFITLDMDVENLSDQPIAIRAMRPAVVEGGEIRGFGGNVGFTTLNYDQRGRYSVIEDNQAASLILFEVAQPQAILALAMPQSGRMRSNLELTREGDTWQGKAESTFDPPVAIQPGARLSADPLLLSYSVPEKETLLQLYAWVQSEFVQMQPPAMPPKAWVSDSGSAADIARAAEAWSGAGIKHALVPADFKGDLGQAAKAVKQAGAAPGVAIDPLRDGGAGWTNIGDPAAEATAKDRVDKLRGAGYEFIALAPTQAPDEVLQQFGMTRNEANHRAMTVYSLAAGDTPVVATAETELPATTAVWDQLAHMTKWFADYRSVPGPVRLRSGDVGDLPPGFTDALQRFNGPVEVVGVPSPAVREALGSALTSEPPQG